jgi:hypothetical protein
MDFSRGAARAVIKLQQKLGLHPKNFCLITGAPRSGTTAVADWLARQRGVAGFSEHRILVAAHCFLEQIDRFHSLKRRDEMLILAARQLVYGYYARSKILLGRGILIDKEPLEPIAFPDKQYDKFLENVRALMPEAKLLFMIRDPLATVWSMTQRTWGTSLRNARLRTYSIDEHTENWCACAEIIVRQSPHPNTYVCQYGRLIADPKGESARMFEFLNIKGRAFEPRPNNKIPGFNPEEREWILRATHDRRERLFAQGITDL